MPVPGGVSLSGSVHGLQDSVRVESPLPGGLSALVRFLFNLPQWLQWSALAVGVVATMALVTMAWLRRRQVMAWLESRSRPVMIGLALAGLAGVAAAAGGGAYGWHYSQHDNGFCIGCHVMKPAYARFTQSQHSQLECHSCHQQPITASVRQLYLWVAERPAEIGPHAKVPTEVCASCHVTRERETWQRIASTAGHRVHLESDSSALRGVQCVTCHGVEVHQFAPVSKTCGQAGCHESVGITLGKMQSQTSLHCVSCHSFTAEVPALATRDSAAGTLVPGERQCMVCHSRHPNTSTFDAAKDPHSGTCGMCHNPHTQRVARDAAKTCASAGCHSDWRKEPFHTGVRHQSVATQCTLCHEPHQARVDASDCAGCHQAVQGRKSGRRILAPPVPFDTTAALRGALLNQQEDLPHGKGDIPPPVEPPPGSVGLQVSAAPSDTFSHARHTKIACVTCHLSDRQHGTLAFEPPRGCQICHHQKAAQSSCSTCHALAQLSVPLPARLRVAVQNNTPRERDVTFSHATHQSTRCVECHTTPVTLAPAPPVVACTGCHESHHAAGRTCSGCHTGAGLDAAHRPGLASHTGCDRCHRSATVSELVPSRSLCLTCHERQREHYAAKECTTCHFQAEPAAFRRHLLQPTDRS
jgi:hypothetical protein